ncbi:MAG: methyltransferase [Sphingobacteriales bacterium]|nr:MAG: methyltransferase [Sphingobacteriales bacterium]
MARIRTPFTGVGNIIRFNWHFYILAIASIILLYFVLGQWSDATDKLIYIAIALISLTTIISLAVSWYVYDLSSMYRLDWLKLAAGNILNIHAGFDETSQLIADKFPGSNLSVCDFYDPAKHTEVSIKRARNAYPQFPGTVHIDTGKLPFANGYGNAICLIFAAHEIRDEGERVAFFKELARALSAGSEIIVTEHLRDTANFLAYNIGFLHFYSRATWLYTFHAAGLNVKKQIKITPFITTFVLCKNDIAA